MVARSYFWWPELEEQIEFIVSSCEECQKHRNNPEPVKGSWPSPHGPWERIHIDHAGPHNGHIYFIVVDAYSRWVVVKKVKHLSSQETVNIFCTHGIPSTIVSDNHQSFRSQIMMDFTKKNGIKHIFTAPYHPSSNGQVERQVQTIKRRLEKLETYNIEITLPRLLFSLRTTPNCATGKSPAELLVGRRLRTIFDWVNPNFIHEDEERD
ncbi:hypothetical protein JTB14_035931 [Gonioctena quinquepunctata]|nr:hypothetical protein JTB14_035931 [Gonioctena quinquepunctata]